jgi:hypothetical protein
MVEITKIEVPKVKTELANIERWEDDGGQIVEADPSTLIKRPLVQPIRPAGHNRSWFRRFPKKEEPNEQKSWFVARP